jgi:hypothetical protein
MNFLNFIRKIKIINIESNITSIFLNYVITDSNNQKCCSISKTSFAIKNSFLENLFYIYLQEKIEDLLKKDIILNNIWYQIYDEKSYSEHPYHTHEDCDFSGILYLQLPIKLGTKFIINNRVFSPNVRDNQLIIFKSNLTHCSPPNDTDYKKIIVAFNLSVI